MRNFANVDHETALAILELQLGDVEEYVASRKGKHKAGDTPDVEQAFLYQQEELHASIAYLRDRILCESISTAVQDDGVAISLARAEEIQTLNENVRGRNLSEGAVDENNELTSDCRERSGELDLLPDDTIDRLASLNIFEAESSNSGAETSGVGGPRRDAETVDCTACTESVLAGDVFVAPCGDSYCHDCVRHLFQEALTDESLFPPRCCRQDLPLSKVRHIIGPRMTQMTEMKGIEVATTNRVYCSNHECCLFIPPYLITGGQSVACPKCPTRTCVRCKLPDHSGGCEEAADTQILELAGQRGWQRCYQCQTLVELGTGCNHIT